MLSEKHWIIEQTQLKLSESEHLFEKTVNDYDDKCVQLQGEIREKNP